MAAALMAPVVAWLAAAGPTELADALAARHARAMERARLALVAIEVPRRRDEVQPPDRHRTPLERMMEMFNRTSLYRDRPEGPVPGVIVDPAGWVATTYFNVHDAAGDDVRVRLHDGTWLPGRITGLDPALEVALIRVERGEHLLPAPPPDAPPHELQPGRPVVLLGLSPDDLEPNLSQGVISAPTRFFGFCVGHDARVDWTNLGGSLVDGEGQLIGIACQVNDESIATAGLASGVSFALRMDRLRREMPQLQEGRRSRGAFIGIRGQDLEEGGVRVASVIPNSGAERAQLRPGDVILEVNGEMVQTMEQLRMHTLRRNPGEAIRLRIRRGEEEMEVEVLLGERPAP